MTEFDCRQQSLRHFGTLIAECNQKRPNLIADSNHLGIWHVDCRVQSKTTKFDCRQQSLRHFGTLIAECNQKRPNLIADSNQVCMKETGALSQPQLNAPLT
jgi:hypothetical protein